MFDHRLQRRSNIKRTLDQCLVFATEDTRLGLPADYIWMTG